MILSFVFNDTATTEIYTLSLHDALPIFVAGTVVMTASLYAFDYQDSLIVAFREALFQSASLLTGTAFSTADWKADRKSTRLNSSHANISYAVFCLKKKKDENRRSTIVT